MKWIAEQLPDVPRWVEARSLLLDEDCEVFGLREEPELSLVIRDRSSGALFVVGVADPGAIRAAVSGDHGGIFVIAPPESADPVSEALPSWRRTRAILHVLPDETVPAGVERSDVRFVAPDELRCVAEPELRRELEVAAQYTAIAGTFVDGAPVSFCYAGSVTESLWDVSIDTLAAHRRNGYAAACAAYMIRHMLAQGRQPVWGAVVENPASWQLARKLGFVAVDEVAMFEPPSPPTG